MNSRINRILILVVSAALCIFVGTLLIPSQKSILVQEIDQYREVHGTGSRLDLTPVLEDHLRIGAELKDTQDYFEQMRFTVHQSHQNKDVYVADYKPTSFIRWFGVVENYRVLLYFSNGKLNKFEGSVYAESP